MPDCPWPGLTSNILPAAVTAMLFAWPGTPAAGHAPEQAAGSSPSAASPTVRLDYRPSARHLTGPPPQSPQNDEPFDANPPHGGFGDDPFRARTTVWTASGAYSRDPDHAHIYLTQVTAGYYLYDNFAVHLGGTFGYADSERSGRSGVLGGPEFRLRWHVWQEGRWSAFIDGSAGMVFHQTRLTEDSLPFNFNLQAGAGATYQLDSRTILKGGARWHHFSNARVKGVGRNIGYDGPMVYFGIMRPF